MVEEISDTIRMKIKELTDNPDEQKMLEKLLQKTAQYNKQTNPTVIKREFSLLLDEHFPFEETD